MKTQIQLAESARRKVAAKYEGFAFIMSCGHPPTRAELAALRIKRPELWSAYPDSACSDAENPHPRAGNITPEDYYGVNAGDMFTKDAAVWTVESYLNCGYWRCRVITNNSRCKVHADDIKAGRC